MLSLTLSYANVIPKQLVHILVILRSFVYYLRQDEYDPAIPNQYQDVLRERAKEKRKQEAEMVHKTKATQREGCIAIYTCHRQRTIEKENIEKTIGSLS